MARTVEIPSRPEVISALRKKVEPSGRQFARMVGISPTMLHDIEQGRRNGSRDLLERIAVALDVDLSVIAEVDRREAA